MANTAAWAAPLFGARRAYPVGTSPVGIISGEFNGAPGLDLATADEGNTVTILANQGDGVFSPATSVPIEDRFTVTGIVGGMFNADAITDFALSANDIQSFPDFNGAIVIHTSNSALHYTPLAMTVGLSPTCVISADLNGDGIDDLASCDSTKDGQGSVSILTGNADHSFNAAVQIPLGSIFPNRLIGTDIDHDGRTDILAVDQAGNAVWILYGNASASIFDAPVQLPTVASPAAALVAQFGNDTLPDIAVVDHANGKVQVFRQQSSRTFVNSSSNTVGLFPVDIAAARFAGNQTLDLVVANNGSGDVTLLIGNADGSFRQGETVRVGDGPVAIVAGDFNDDSKPDFATADQEDQSFGADRQSVSVVLNGVSPPLTATPSPTVTRTPRRSFTPTLTPPRTLNPTPSRTRTPTPTAGTPVPTPTPAGPGDSNCDGKINAQDLDTVIHRIFDGTSGCLGRPVSAADLPLFVRLISNPQP